MLDNIFLIFSIIILLVFTFVFFKTRKRKFFVYRVVDGDTIHARRNTKTDKYIKVRLIGINAPESKDWGAKRKEEFGTESKDFLKNLLPKDTAIYIEYDKQKIDKFDRHLCYVYKEEVFVNEFIVKNGFAEVFIMQPNSKYETELLKAEKKAKFNNKGIWQK